MGKKRFLKSVEELGKAALCRDIYLFYFRRLL